MHGDELARATGVPKPGRRLQPSEGLPKRERGVGSTLDNVKGEQTGISLGVALLCGVEFRCARARRSSPRSKEDQCLSGEIWLAQARSSSLGIFKGTDASAIAGRMRPTSTSSQARALRQPRLSASGT
jgi:hypothetical protein